jgi:hypothetical protein
MRTKDNAPLVNSQTVEENEGILLVNPQYRNWCAQHVFLEGKKAEEISPRKGTSRTLK